MTDQAIPRSSERLTKRIQGHEFPTLGFGTFKLSGDACRRAVTKALQTGYRHIDTARMYENEEMVGLGIRDSGLERREFFVTSKVWWEDLSPKAIRSEVEASLKALQTDYLDLVLIHWPNPEFSIQKAVETFQELKDSGKIHLYGVSNFTPSLFEEAARYGEIFCNQVEYHPFLGQQQLLEVLRRHDSALIAYSPLAQGDVIENLNLKEIGEKHGKSPGQVALRWLVEQDNVFAIPRSSKPEHIESNFDIFDFALDEADRQRIAALPKDRRQVNPGFAPAWENENQA
ncbi:MAG: aldo/keto reductase [Oceanipulchritudo sp.]